MLITLSTIGIYVKEGIYLKRYIHGAQHIEERTNSRYGNGEGAKAFYYYTLYCGSMYVTCALNLSVYQQ